MSYIPEATKDLAELLAEQAETHFLAQAEKIIDELEQLIEEYDQFQLSKDDLLRRAKELGCPPEYIADIVLDTLTEDELIDLFLAGGDEIERARGSKLLLCEGWLSLLENNTFGGDVPVASIAKNKLWLFLNGFGIDPKYDEIHSKILEKADDLLQDFQDFGSEPRIEIIREYVPPEELTDELEIFKKTPPGA